MNDEKKQKMTNHSVLNQAVNSAHVIDSINNASFSISSTSNIISSQSNNASEQLTLKNSIIIHHIRSSSSSDQLIVENSSSTHHIENNATLSEKSYESVEK
jgi:hypothetical protein